MIASATIVCVIVLAKLGFDHFRKKSKFLGESTTAWLSLTIGIIYSFILIILGIEIRFPSGKVADPGLAWRNGPWAIGFLLIMALIQQLIVMRRRKKRRIEAQSMDTHIKPPRNP